MMRNFFPMVLSMVFWALLGSATSARAQEYCVSCAEPNAVYRCVLTDARPGLGQSLQVACLTALAKDGRHTQCSVKRGVTVFECDGPVKRVSVADQPDQSAVVAPSPAAASDPNAPPKTVLEAAQRAKQASDAQMRKAGENMKEAGDATAGFFKRTLTCIGSLFTRCGADP